ncbi:hypothetical protein D3C81_2112140 [compost metagenome]
MPSSGISVQDTWLLTHNIGRLGSSPIIRTSKGRAATRRFMNRQVQRWRRSLEAFMPMRSPMAITLAMSMPKSSTSDSLARRANTRSLRIRPLP